MLDANLKEQLQGYLGRLTQPIEIIAALIRPVHIFHARPRHNENFAKDVFDHVTEIQW